MRNIIKKLNETNHNFVFSPVSLYHALALLAQTTDGDTQKEIIDAIGLTKEELVKKVNSLSENLSINEEDNKLMVNSSLWLSNSFNTNDDKLKDISNKNNCKLEKVLMGTSEADNKIKDWVNKNTNNLLKDSVKNIKTDYSTLFELYTTIYLKSKWEDRFEEEDTKRKTFHVSNTVSVKCDFMNQCNIRSLYTGKRFKAVALYLNEIGKMMFILPNEGLTISDISNDEDVLDFLEGKCDSVQEKEYLIDLSIPKFDISTNKDILNKIRELGINKVLDIDEADFSPISNEKELYLGKAEQATRLIVNENGVEASAYTEMCVACGSICLDMPEEIEFKLDRPFVFSIVKDVDDENVPLFVGSVVDPTVN